jgi:proteasome accessory factor A
MTAIFERLVGLETEYAIRCRPPPFEQRPTDLRLFRSLEAALKQKIPSAEANPGQWKPGAFLATGGAVWFEQSRSANQVGLVEGCTPECRSPRQLLACQRALDRLLSETARTAGPGFCLLKNCRDSQGETYGAQENYSVHLAAGWRHKLWRVGWIVLWVLFLISLSIIIVVGLLGIFSVLLVTWLFYILACLVVRPDKTRRERWRIRLFGKGWACDDPEAPPWPDWMEGSLFVLLKLVFAPALILASWLVAVTDLRRTQRRLLAFLASRAILGGSGWLAPDGRFHLTEKAQTRGTLWTEALADQSHPVFAIAQFYKLAWSIRPRWKELMAPRQRLQICLGDSNLCQEAEYLRVAATVLVLDAIEAGAITNPPCLRRPLRAIRQISQDPDLTVDVAVRGRQKMTALDLQRWYLEACERFVASVPEAPEEAREVLRLWADVLDKLETDRAALVGRLDWVTKQFLLERVGAGLPYAARKKIDLRYHELSPEGYFAQIEAAGLTAPVVSEEEVEQAMRMPPLSSPAWKRGRYIREFSGSGLLTVGWRFLTVRGEGDERSVIDLHDPA